MTKPTFESEVAKMMDTK